MGKRGLGRGIDALLQGLETEGASQDAIQSIPVDRLTPNPAQPRKSFPAESLNELAASIRQKGVLQPILVERVADSQGENPRYEIIAGERRFRAARIAGLKEVPVLVRSFSDAEKLEIALIENIQREDLDPIEEAKAYQALMTSSRFNQEQLSERVGKNRSTIANALRLLKLPTKIQQALSSGDLTPGHARALLSVENESDRMVLFERITGGGLSVREAEELARGGGVGTARAAGSVKAGRDRARSGGAAGTAKSVELTDLQERLIRILGTKVTVSGSHARGKIEISYFSLDDLERIIEILER